MTVGGARAEGAALLRARGVETPELDASLLLAQVLGIERTRLLMLAPEEFGAADHAAYRKLLERRASGTCVAYLLGRREFRGLDFLVDPSVLVPRPDTETLVEAALEHLAAAFPLDSSPGGRRPARRPRILDLCTGSGCVAVSLAAERPDALVSACDLSPAALELARRNAARLLPGRLPHPADGRSAGAVPAGAPSGVPAAVHFFLSDLFSAAAGPYDLIVTNPPYVPGALIDGLSAEVRGEPRMALDGGEDGLDLIRRIVQESPSRLDQGGRILVESGFEQAAEIARLMERAGLRDIRSYRDLAGLERVSGASL